eukprot:TRINITY_DN5028_c0_g1_i1.p2 TRINITY_DN5028_c0_g1~~TRINITY_DN5028_c0_g1_i1.p2  ORF type:complete len:91 (-),score=19.63 TRINITY_DN5028_c0_g1_i1:359-631(-)
MEKRAEKQMAIGEWDSDEGDHMLYERKEKKSDDDQKLEKQDIGAIPAQILAPFKRLLQTHLQRILWSLNLWYPFPSFTAKSVTLVYPPNP